MTLSAVIHREGDVYVAECPELGTVSQTNTLEEAVANLEEATGLHQNYGNSSIDFAVGAFLRMRCVPMDTPERIGARSFALHR